MFSEKCSACSSGNPCEMMDFDFDVDAIRKKTRNCLKAKEKREKKLQKADRSQVLPTEGSSFRPAHNEGMSKAQRAK